MTVTAVPNRAVHGVHGDGPTPVWYWWRRAIVATAAGIAIGLALPLAIRAMFGMTPLWDLQVEVTSAGLIAPFFFWGGIGCFDYWARWARGRHVDEDDHSMHGARSWRDYFVVNTDHKVIGIQYLAAISFFFLAGGLAAMLLRTELAGPGQDLLDTRDYNGMFSGHATLMIFAFIIPGWSGFANYVLPLMIGARDMAFPRLNALSFWVFLVGASMLTAGMLVPGRYAAGWTAYVPLAIQGGTGQTLFEVGLQFAGVSSIMAGINILATIITMRAPGMTVWRLPLFIWSVGIQSALIVFSTPVLAGSQFMSLFDRIVGTGFFRPASGGDVIAYEHLFWFYSHPTVYIWVLPGFGVVTEVISTFSRKPIFGYRAMAFALTGIAILGFGVWAHHMFVSGMASWLRFPMMITTVIIAVPTGVKIFTWLATLWGGRVRWTTPMLFAIGFIVTFVIGGLSGVMLGAIPVDIQVTDTYFVVAHLHYVVIPGALMTMIAAVYYWFPKITGRMYDERLGRLHFWTFFISMNATFMPMHWLGLMGMPRRVAAYDPRFENLNRFITVSSYVLGLSMVIFLYNIVRSWRSGPPAGWNPYRSRTLEWQIPSPPPLFNFDSEPHVVGGPYQYGVGGARHAVVFAAPDAGGGELTEDRRDVVLVVADRTLTTRPLRDAVIDRSRDGGVVFRVVVPVAAGARVPAARRLVRALAVLREHGVTVDGEVVEGDALEAAATTGERGHAVELMVGILTDERVGWRGHDLPDRLRKRTGTPLTMVPVSAADERAGLPVPADGPRRVVIVTPRALDDPDLAARIVAAAGANPVPTVVAVPLDLPPAGLDRRAEAHRSRASRALARLLGRLLAQGLPAHGEVVDGDAARAVTPYRGGGATEVLLAAAGDEAGGITAALAGLPDPPRVVPLPAAGGVGAR
ncbi:MAG: cytochrome c oxidase subunit I [Thermoleophilia bacterium]